MKDYSAASQASSTIEAKVTSLDNGLRVVSLHRPVHTAMVSVFVNTGSANERPEESGLSHFLEHMAFKGTKDRTQHQITMEIERLGADINAFTSYNMTAYYVKGLAGHVPTALDILSDVVLNSVFDTQEIEREKGVVIEEINEYKDDIDDLSHQALMSHAFPDQSSGRPILGYPETVSSFTREMLLDYIDRHYGPSNIIVVGIGPMDHEEFVGQVKARMGHVPSRAQDGPVTPVYGGGSYSETDTGDRFEQSQIAIAFPAPDGNSEGFAPFSVMCDVLGGGMSSPLFQEVREVRGLAYSVYSFVKKGSEVSLALISGSTSTKNVPEFISVCATELAKIAKGEINDFDWERARNQAICKTVEKEEKGLPMASYAASQLFQRGSIQTLDEIVQRYLSVTREEVIEAAQSCLSGPMTLSVTGKQQDLDLEALFRQGAANV